MVTCVRQQKVAQWSGESCSPNLQRFHASPSSWTLSRFFGFQFSEAMSLRNNEHDQLISYKSDLHGSTLPGWHGLTFLKWPGIPTAKPTHLRHVWEHPRSPWAPGCSDRSIFIVGQLLGHHRWTQFNGKASKHPSKVACLKLSVWCFFSQKIRKVLMNSLFQPPKTAPPPFTHTPPRSSSDTNHTRRRRPTKASSSAPASTFGPKQPKSPLERHRWFLKRSRIPFFVCFAA